MREHLLVCFLPMVRNMMLMFLQKHIDKYRYVEYNAVKKIIYMEVEVNGR